MQDFGDRTGVQTVLDPVQLENMAQNLRNVSDMWHSHNFFERIPKGWQREAQIGSAEKLGLVIIPASYSQPTRYMLFSPGQKTCVQGSRTSRASYAVEALNNDKAYSKAIMEEAGVAVAKCRIVNSLEEARAARQELGAVVVKPAYGSLYSGVSINVNDDETLEKAWTHARDASPTGKILIEEFIRGADLRVNVAGGKVTAIYLRIGANVIGDGKRSIKAIIQDKNRMRATIPGFKGKRIQIDDRARRMLASRGMTEDSVPAENEIVMLGVIPNLYGGADYYPITDRVHPKTVQMVERAAHLLGGCDYWGFDVLTEDFAADPDKRRTVICESNTRPNILYFQYISHGEPINNFHDFYLAATDGTVTQRAWERKEIRIFIETIGDFDLEFLNKISKEIPISFDIFHNDGGRYCLTFTATEADAIKFVHALRTKDKEATSTDIVAVCLNPATASLCRLPMALKPSTFAQDSLSDGRITQLVAEVLKAGGYEHTRVLEGNLLEIEQGDQTRYSAAGLAGTTVQNLLGETHIPFQNLMFELSGVQTHRNIRLAGGDQPDRIRKFVTAFPGPVEVHYRRKDAQLAQVVFNGRRSLNQFLNKNQYKDLLFARTLPESHMPEVSVVFLDGKIVGTLVREFPQIIGDGVSSSRDLVRALMDRLASNPRHKKLTEVDPEWLLKRMGEDPERVMGAGETVHLRFSPSRIVTCASQTEKSLHDLARKGYEALPDLSLAEVVLHPFVARDGAFEWLVSHLTSGARTVDEFAFPDAGQGIWLPDVIAKEHVLGNDARSFISPITCSRVTA